MKPSIASFHACGLVLFPDGTDSVKSWVPILIEESDKQLLHRHLRHSIHIQIRQDAGDIVQQNPVAPDNVEILRTEFFLIIIQDI